MGFETTSRALNAGWGGDHLSLSEQHTGRALLTLERLRNLPQSHELLFLAGQRPIISKNLLYYEDREFGRKFETP